MPKTYRQTPTQKGRKRLPEAQRRSCAVTFRLSDAERAALTARAEAAGVTLTDYARAALLDKEAALPSQEVFQGAAVTPHQAQFVVQLIRLGNNLNQIARAVNQHRVTFQDVAELHDLIARIDTLLKDNGA